MGAPRRKNLVKSRKRVEDDGDEEEGSVVAVAEEDSLSEGSALSDADDDADGEGSDGDDTLSPTQEVPKAGPMANGHRQKSEDSGLQQEPQSTGFLHSLGVNDTQAMMNGLKISEVEDEGVAFEDMGKHAEVQSPGNIAHSQVDSSTMENLADSRRREHEEYKKRRDADPAFVPNRGGFFMHDHRSVAPGQNGFRPFGRGRGRGRGTIRGPFPSISQSAGPADSPWAHDLHESITQVDAQPVTGQILSHSSDSRVTTSNSIKSQPPNRSFSRTTRIGNVQIRVFLGGMTDPIVFSAVPVNQHTRLPHHRPPLRRDKPVRISLPEIPIRYIFPSIDRSFIFIPRALRPNQQGFGRTRGRGSFGGAYSAFGGFSSRRTSAYAGSGYSPSVALSRRSSVAREVPTESAVLSGAGNGNAIVQGTAAPVVRLPPAAEQLQPSNQQAFADASNAPTVNLPQASAYPLPSKPALRENRPDALPMQHPKPQRTVQVADIDSPATLEFNPPQQQQQLPFHQQVPAQITGQVYQPEYAHSAHLSQASGSTPIPQIPDRAIHAQPFQPFPYQQPQNFYPQPMPPPLYYYPPPDQASGAPSAAAPAFVPGQQYQYSMPFTPAAITQPQQLPQQPSESTTQGGTVAQEINGMVYYLDPSQIAASSEHPASYPPAGYPVPNSGGVIGMGGMMTPPIYYPPPPPTFYPQQ